MRALIVEDDFTSRLILQQFLSRYGECHIAVNGKEAIKAFQLAREGGAAYDLICMDIMMPEMDGQEALREIRKQEASARVPMANAVKIIMTTGLTGRKDVMNAYREQCDAYLLKPIDTNKLLESLRLFHLA